MLSDPWGASEVPAPARAAVIRPRVNLVSRRRRQRIRGGMILLILAAAGFIGWEKFARPWLASRDAQEQARLQRAGAIAAGAQARAPRWIESARRYLEAGDRQFDRWNFAQAGSDWHAAGQAYAIASDLSVLVKESESLRSSSGGESDPQLAALLNQFDQAQKTIASDGAPASLDDAQKSLDHARTLLAQAKARIATLDEQASAAREYQALCVIVEAARQSRADACFPEPWSQLQSRLPASNAATQLAPKDISNLAAQFSSLRDRAITASLEARQARREADAAHQQTSRWVNDDRRAELTKIEDQVCQQFDQGLFLQCKDQYRTLARDWQQAQLAAQFDVVLQQTEQTRSAALQANAQMLAGAQWREADEQRRLALSLKDHKDFAAALAGMEQARRVFAQATTAAIAERHRQEQVSQTPTP